MTTEDEDDTPRRGVRTRTEILIGKGEPVARPTIIDALDGLPRPDDEVTDLQGIPPETDETFVCTEGGNWLRWDEATSTTQPALDAFREDDLVLYGFTAKGRDGALGQDRIFKHVVTGALYRRARPVCAFYQESIQPENGMIREGATGPALTLLRQCSVFNEALSDETVLACGARAPRDLISENVLVRRARMKKAQAALPPTQIFPTMSPEENARQLGNLNPYDSDVKAAVVRVESPHGDELKGLLIVVRPDAGAAETLRYQPQIVYYCDKAWQPLDKDIVGVEFTALDGQRRPWGVSSPYSTLNGEIVARFDGQADDDLLQFPRFRRGLWKGNVRAIAQTLLDGRNVAIVPYHQSTLVTFVDALRRDVHVLVQSLIDGYERDGKVVYDDPSVAAAPHVLPYRAQGAPKETK